MPYLSLLLFTQGNLTNDVSFVKPFNNYAKNLFRDYYLRNKLIFILQYKEKNT